MEKIWRKLFIYRNLKFKRNIPDLFILMYRSQNDFFQNDESFTISWNRICMR